MTTEQLQFSEHSSKCAAAWDAATSCCKGSSSCRKKMELHIPGGFTALKCDQVTQMCSGHVPQTPLLPQGSYRAGQSKSAICWTSLPPCTPQTPEHPKPTPLTQGNTPKTSQPRGSSTLTPAEFTIVQTAPAELGQTAAGRWKSQGDLHWTSLWGQKPSVTKCTVPTSVPQQQQVMPRETEIPAVGTPRCAWDTSGWSYSRRWYQKHCSDSNIPLQ